MKLGQNCLYPQEYDPKQLHAIARSPNRQELGLPEPLPFTGADIWNAYEISWLNANGKPQVAIGCFIISADSPCLIESKSLKLYLNSLNQTCFADIGQVRQILTDDLSQAAGLPVQVQLSRPAECTGSIRPLAGRCLDDIDLVINQYQPQVDCLQLAGTDIISEQLVSDLLKSNCPVTGQPDWASVQICYTGKPIDHAGLLRYIVSLRQQQEFHENCIERIFIDIYQQCQPEELSVYARYTRRGGLDINPWRSTKQMQPDNIRTPRQ